jgi:flagellar basal-body rod protein FlgF
MDPLTIAAAGGLRSRMESLDLLANKLANAATNGYKNDREFYGLYASADSINPDTGGASTLLPVVEKQWTDFSQGVLQTTGNPLDVALSGKGFLVVKGQTGPLYTRNGSLQVSASGELINGDGFALTGVDGKSLKVAPGKPVEIQNDGTISQEGQSIGRLQIVDFKSTDVLRKAAKTCFQNPDAANKPIPAAATQILQGRIENSNVSVAESAMRLVGIMRQFEMLQKAIGISGEMNSKTIQEVARISP